MDMNDSYYSGEVNSFVSMLQRLLPKKKDLIVFEPHKNKLTRLSDVHAEAKSVFPKCFIGANVVVLREIMDRVKLVQTYNFGKPRDTYKTYSQLIHKEMDPKNVADGLEIDSSGSATATYKEVIEGSYEMRLTSKIKDIVSSETEITFEKEAEKSISSITCNMKDVDPNTLKLITQCMYRVLPEFSLGSEVTFKPLAYPASPELSLSARYEKASFNLSTTINRAGFQVCLFKQFGKDLRIATIVNEGTRGGPAVFGLALHKNYLNGSELKIFVDSQRCGGFTFQKDVLFHEQNDTRILRLIGSTLIDRQRRVRFGLCFNLDF